MPLTVTLILFEELVDREAMAQREREREDNVEDGRGLESSMAKRAQIFSGSYSTTYLSTVVLGWAAAGLLGYCSVPVSSTTW